MYHTREQPVSYNLSTTQAIEKSNVWLKKTVADLRKRILRLENENKRLAASMKKCEVAHSQMPGEEKAKRARFTSRGIHSLRKKMRFSQADFRNLLGTTPHAVYLWEKKAGALNLRDKTKAAILSIRGMGAREAKEKLNEIRGRLKRGREVASKA